MKLKHVINCPRTPVVTVPRNSIRGADGTLYKGMNGEVADELGVPWRWSKCTVLVEKGAKYKCQIINHEITERDVASTGHRYPFAHKIANVMENIPHPANYVCYRHRRFR